VLFSDPEGLAWLAAQDAPPRPRLLLTSAAYLAPVQRSQLQERFGVPIINYYSSTETGPIAWECLLVAGRFHVLLPEVWVESVAGELVVTRLRPSVQPVLRYRTGDAGRVSPDACACGYHGLTITGFTGRSACSFRRPDGLEVDAWRLAVVLKYSRLRVFRLHHNIDWVGRFAVLSRKRGPGVEPLLQVDRHTLENARQSSGLVRRGPRSRVELDCRIGAPARQAGDVAAPGALSPERVAREPGNPDVHGGPPCRSISAVHDRQYDRCYDGGAGSPDHAV
jgi:hypothetical protein